MQGQAYIAGGTSRRECLAMLGGLLAAVAARSAAPLIKPRYRIISDNDYVGDPDGLFQLAHHLLSPSVEMRLIVGSHIHAKEDWPVPADQSGGSVAKVNELLSLMKRGTESARGGDSTRGAGPKVVQGAAGALDRKLLTSATGLKATAAAEAIIAEAMREDTDLPLFYCAGAGLTDLATAWLLEPRIGRRLKLVWIGGPEYPGTPPPPGKPQREYNLTIDIPAVQVLFNRSDIEIWQVPRSSYRQMIIGYQELLARVRPTGPLGDWLVGNLEKVMEIINGLPAALHLNAGETYVLGDSPLVTLTALQSAFEAEPASSRYELRQRPSVTDAGDYGPAVRGKTVRVYTQIDTRLTFGDLFAKLEAFGKSS